MTNNAKYALQALRQSDEPFLTALDIAPILGCDPAKIRKTAKDCPGRLGFPVCVMGTRVRIPRLPFLRFVDGET